MSNSMPYFYEEMAFPKAQASEQPGPVRSHQSKQTMSDFHKQKLDENWLSLKPSREEKNSRPRATQPVIDVLKKSLGGQIDE